MSFFDDVALPIVSPRADELVNKVSGVAKNAFIIFSVYKLVMNFAKKKTEVTYSFFVRCSVMAK